MLYLETQHEGVWRSENGGADWWPINEGLEGVRTGAWGAGAAVTASMRMDREGYVIYLGTVADGVYRLILRPPCPGNFDGDHDVDLDDLKAITPHWHQQPDDPNWEARFDLNNDGVVNIVDIMRVAAAWGEPCP